MTFTYDPTTDRGRVRLIITDTDSTHEIFNDGEIDAFLDLSDQDIRLASAQALDTIASSEALVQKRITQMDLSTDGPAVARALRDHAETLRQQVNEGSAFDWAEMVVGSFSAREIARKAGLRGA